MQIEQQHVRSPGEIETGAADLRAYFVGVSGVWPRLLPLAQPIFGETEKELFPGIVVPFLAALALGGAMLRRTTSATWLATYALMVVAGFLLSLGPVVRVWGVVLTRHGPYDWLQHLVPGMGGMRTPSRFVVVAILGLSVLAGYGATQLVDSIRPRLRPIAIVALLAGVVADGWAVPISTVPYSPRGRPEDRAVASWLADAPPGAVLHLPIVTYHFQELNYQYATLFHHHPLVNGFTGWDSPLQQLFRHPRGPLYDYARYAATVKMLRSIGVRYVVVHPGDYNVTQLADGELTQTVNGIRGSGQVREEKRLLDVYAFELIPFPAPPKSTASRPIPAASFAVDVSEQRGRAELLVDGDNDSRWIGVQNGSSAISARFDRPHDVARVELQLAERSLMDFPRELQIDAEDAGGRSRTLYRAPPFPEFLAGFLRDRSYPSIAIDLPANETVVLRLRDVAVYDTWWSVHELRLWSRP